MAVRGALRLHASAVGGVLSRQNIKAVAVPVNTCLAQLRQSNGVLVQRMYLSAAAQTKPSPAITEKVEEVATTTTKQNIEVQGKDSKPKTSPLSILRKDDYHRPDLAHFRAGAGKTDDVEKHVKDDGTVGLYTMPHPIWTQEEVNSVKINHTPPQTFVDKLAYRSVRFMRWNFDLFSGFKFGKRTERKWLQRIIFLETVAGVPGMVAAMTRHLHSLRRLRRDYGWIHTLLEEAENERMHLMTALQLRQPSVAFRLWVLFAQGTFVTLFSAAYLVSPKFCHRFVGYLEEEAVKTYTKCLEDFDSGRLPLWNEMEAPPLAKRYWNLGPDAMMRDVILAIRADEAHHRLVNHTLSEMDQDAPNPFQPGK